jgi:hypothetical protein
MEHLPIHGLDSNPHRAMLSALQETPQQDQSEETKESIKQFPISQRWVILPPPEYSTQGLKRIPSQEGIQNGVGKLTPLIHQFHPTHFGFKTSDNVGEGDIFTFEKLERTLWEQTVELLSPTIQESPSLPNSNTTHHLDDIARILGLEDCDADEIVLVLKRLAMEGGVSVHSARFKRIIKDFEKYGFES